MKFRRLLFISAAVLTLGLSGCKGTEMTTSAVDRGMTEIEQHNYQGALETFGSSIAEKKDLAMAYRGEGIAYMGLGDYEKAVLAFQSALENTNEKFTDSQDDINLYLASANYKAGNYSETVNACQEVLKNKENGDAYYMRGSSYLELGEEEKAKADFDKVSSLSTEDYNLFFNIYESYNQKNMSAMGDEYLQKALSIKGEEVNDYYQRGRIYYYLENYDKAKEQLLKAAAEKDKDSMLLLGSVYLAMEDPVHAESVYQEYMTSYGESPEAYNGIALCELANGSPDESLAAIEKGLALEQEENKQDLYYNEIVAYERKMDFATAGEKAQLYIQKYPEDLDGKKEAEFLSTR